MQLASCSPPSTLINVVFAAYLMNIVFAHHCFVFFGRLLLRMKKLLLVQLLGVYHNSMIRTLASVDEGLMPPSLSDIK
jgi:hypothetical protein